MENIPKLIFNLIPVTSNNSWPVLQVNLFQKLATSAEHVVCQNCSECQNKTKITICVHNMLRYCELTIFMNNEQSVVILCVSWCKNKSFWQKFTCITLINKENKLTFILLNYCKACVWCIGAWTSCAETIWVKEAAQILV